MICSSDIKPINSNSAAILKLHLCDGQILFTKVDIDEVRGLVEFNYHGIFIGAFLITIFSKGALDVLKNLQIKSD